MMNSFHAAGEAMLAAEEGRAQFAREISTVVRRWFAGMAAWYARVPTSLPPTESYKR